MRRNQQTFDPDTFLSTIGEGRASVHIGPKRLIFAQGDANDAVFYIQKGNVTLTVLSASGKEAALGILGPGDFFGEGCLAGQSLSMGSARTVTHCDLLRIRKEVMMAALHQEHRLSDRFVAYLLSRSIRHEEDLIDQLFNSSEKRLARILLLLAHFGKKNHVSDHFIPQISQATLAEMVGTTRPRVNFFLGKFKKEGYIRYDGGLCVRSSLLNVLLED